MGSYRVELTRSAEKDLGRIDRGRVAAIYRALEGLSDDPRPHGFKKLTGADRTYRVRVGDYRIVYEIEDEVLVVLVTLDWYTYFGETNGAVYMLRKRVPLVGSKTKEQVFFTEANDSTQEFLQKMRNEAKVEPDGAANGSQPIRSETNRTSPAAGSRR